MLSPSSKVSISGKPSPRLSLPVSSIPIYCFIVAFFKFSILVLTFAKSTGVITSCALDSEVTSLSLGFGIGFLQPTRPIMVIIDITSNTFNFFIVLPPLRYILYSFTTKKHLY